MNKQCFMYTLNLLDFDIQPKYSAQSYQIDLTLAYDLLLDLSEKSQEN